MNFDQAISEVKAMMLADGKIDFAETAALLRLVKPLAVNGDSRAISLEKLLNKVREDGIVTKGESDIIIAALEGLASPKMKLAEYVREIPDFPKPGVLFRDVTGIFDTAEGFKLALDAIDDALGDIKLDVVVAPESRGFIFGAALAARAGKAFVPVRKPGKLPRATISEDYDLEYGKATLHVHADAIISGERVVIVDDLLATGGTAAAAARLVERLGGSVVKMIFPIELEGFEARKHLLANYSVESLIKYPGK